jgi:hypothetical protein
MNEKMVSISKYVMAGYISERFVGATLAVPKFFITKKDASEKMKHTIL